jgi:putative ATP-dependent endonuclease of OLD family
MKIESLTIRNYRSIRELELKLSPRINVFIGANNVGKSNIFSAMEWLVGPSYPTANRLDRHDFYLGDENSELKIALSFDDGNTLSFDSTWIDGYGREKHGLNLNNDYVSDGIREKYVSAYIGPDRKVLDNPANSQWSLLGRMLKEFNSRLYEETITMPDGTKALKSDAFKKQMEEIRDNLLFSIEDDSGINLMKSLADILQNETASQLNCSPNDLSVDLNAYDPWNLYRTLQIYVTEQGTGLQMRASDMGMGVQASITIAILRAYSKLKLNNQTPIFIDEPELYLHPQARRRFYRVIEDLADSGTQVFLTTHSTEFVDLKHFDQIYLVRKSSDKGTYVRTADPSNFVDDLKVRKGIDTNDSTLMAEYSNAFENTGDSQKAAEALFASKILLVEGESESLIVPYCFHRIGYDAIEKGVSIVRCGGKNEIDRFYRLYSEFGIPCYILFDGDAQNIGTKDESHTVKANRSILSIFDNNNDFPDGHVHENYLGFKNRLEDALGIGKIGANVKGLRLYRRFRESIENGTSIPRWCGMIATKLDELPDEAPSILKSQEAAENCWEEEIPF